MFLGTRQLKLKGLGWIVFSMRTGTTNYLCGFSHSNTFHIDMILDAEAFMNLT